MAIERIDAEKCIGCGVCRDVCPVDVIRMDESTNMPIIMYKEECMLCEMCIMECPTDAIEFSPHKVLPLPVSHA